MNIFQVIILGIVQGITEFLPVSSSGHLALLENYWQIESAVSLSIILHCGTLVAVLVFFRKKIKVLIVSFFNFLKKGQGSEAWKIAQPIVVGTLPALIVGFAIKEVIDEIFVSKIFIGIGFLITSALLFWSKRLTEKNKGWNKISTKNSLIVGLFQALAILPGISRSGATITGAYSQKIKQKDAFELAFLLSIPAILGALVLDLVAKNRNGIDWQMSFVGFLISLVTGLISLGLLKKIIKQNKLHYFGWYVLGMGVVSLVLN
jgi:undecaprenyl-diphosphatase